MESKFQVFGFDAGGNTIDTRFADDLDRADVFAARLLERPEIVEIDVVVIGE